MPAIHSASKHSYDIPVFLSMSHMEYKLLIVQYKSTLKPAPKLKPPPKSRDTYYE